MIDQMEYNKLREEMDILKKEMRQMSLWLRELKEEKGMRESKMRDDLDETIEVQWDESEGRDDELSENVSEKGGCNCVGTCCELTEMLRLQRERESRVRDNGEKESESEALEEERSGNMSESVESDDGGVVSEIKCESEVDESENMYMYAVENVRKKERVWGEIEKESESGDEEERNEKKEKVWYGNEKEKERESELRASMRGSNRYERQDKREEVVKSFRVSQTRERGREAEQQKSSR